MSLDIAYNLGREDALEKVGSGPSDPIHTAAAAFVSPTLSGLTADDGKGLQTSLAGMAGSLLGKKLLRSNMAGRFLGAGAATGASKVGAGLVSPDPEVIKQMRDRGEFSRWEYATRGLRTMGTSAAIGGLLASGAGAPAALAGMGVGAGRGAFAGYVTSPMVKKLIHEGMSTYRERQEMRDAGQAVSSIKPPVAEKAMQLAEKPVPRKALDFVHEKVI